MKEFVTKLTAVTLILLLAVSVQSNSKKDPRRTNGNNPVGITYVVNIDASNAGNICFTYIVSIKDENGNNVGNSWVYMEGISSYVFHEAGPVSGTRTAHLDRIDFQCSQNCGNVFYTQPAMLNNNNFRSGRTYIFNLEPTSVPSNN